MAVQDLTRVASRVRVIQPGEGPRGGLAPGVSVIFKIDGADTGGALSVVEHPFEVGSLVPPHVHTREDEVSIVMEGSIGFRSNDQEVVLETGGYIVKPRGQVHAMWNAGAEPARMIEIISPAGFEGFFREMVAITSVRPPEPEEIASLGERYGLPFESPEWLADVIARYGLTPPLGM